MSIRSRGNLAQAAPGGGSGMPIPASVRLTARHMASEIDEGCPHTRRSLIRTAWADRKPRSKGGYPTSAADKGAVEVGPGAYCHFCHADPVCVIGAPATKFPCILAGVKQPRCPRPGAL